MIKLERGQLPRIRKQGMAIWDVEDMEQRAKTTFLKTATEPGGFDPQEFENHMESLTNRPIKMRMIKNSYLKKVQKRMYGLNFRNQLYVNVDKQSWNFQDHVGELYKETQPQRKKKWYKTLATATGMKPKGEILDQMRGPIEA